MVVLLSGVFLLLAAPAFGQVLQVPYVSVAAGLAPGVSPTAAVCSGALNIFGDGCPATQAMVGLPANYYSSGNPSAKESVQEVWTDSYGNVYIVDFNASYELHVIYHGGAPLANLITINNPTLTTPPQVGYIYAIAGSASRNSKYSAVTYCNGTSGIQMVDVYGNGCPGFEAFVEPTGGYTDTAGDVFLVDHAANSNIRVLYAGGVQAANYINLELGITSPVVGTIYRIAGPATGTYGWSGDGGLASSAEIHNPHSLTMDSNGNLYIVDSGNNAVREIAYSTGKISTVAGASCVSTGTTTGCTAGYTADGVAATSSELDAPHEVLVDANGNLYIADTTNNRIRVVYAGGNPAQAILSAEGVTSPVVGDIYTIAGAGSSVGTAAYGAVASALSLTTPETLGMDASGNLYVGDDSGTRAIYRIAASTGIVTPFVYNKLSTWTLTEYCSSGTTTGSGPQPTDTAGDGCPATETGLFPVTNLAFAPNGLAYFGDSQLLVRALTFNQLFPSTAVSSSATLPIAVTSTSSFIAPSISATAQGTTTGDWSASAVTTLCKPGTSYAANTVCVYNITLTPALPGRRLGEYVLTQSGTPVLTQGLEGDGVGSLLAITPTAAATTLGFSIAAVSSVTADMLGDLYISDTSTGKLWEIASGSSTATALLTGLSSPAQSAVDGVGNVYVADTGNNRIVEYTATGSTVSLLTGLSSPKGVAVTGNGTLYVANTGSNSILAYSQETGTTITLPITLTSGATALNAPSALALDGSDNLFIADTGNQRVVEYPNGPWSAVSFGATTVEPVGLAVDAAGDVYVADVLTDSVLRLTPGASTSISLASGLGSPSGISLDAQGDLFYADSSVAGLDEVVQQQGSFTFAKTNENKSSTPMTASIENIGNANLTFTSSPGYTATGDTADFSISAGSSGCGTGTVSLASSCMLVATFSPLSTNLYAETVVFQTNAANNATASIKLSGQGENLINTTTAVVLTSPSSLVYGETGTFTVTITPASGTGAPTGSIAITVDGTNYKTVSVTGTSITFTASLAAGTHVIDVTYGGDTVYASSYATYSITVSTQPTTTTLTYNLSTSSSPVFTLTAQVSPSISGTPTGTVSFYGAGKLYGTPVSLTTGSNVATLVITPPASPSYSFSAQYSGDTNYAASSATAIGPPEGFVLQPTSTAINAVAGYPVATTVSLTSFFGYSGILTFNCSGLPVNAVCRFNPTTVTLVANTSTSATVEFYTNVATGAQASGIGGGKGRGWILLFFLPALLVLFRRMTDVCRRLKLSTMILSVFLLIPVFLWAVTGCGSSSNQYPSTTTPAGNSTVTLTVSDSAGNSQTVTYALTVTPQ
jgi:sugar lactone lactonase YvrE